MHRTASPFASPLLVHLFGNGEGIRIQLDHRLDRRPLPVQFGNPVQVELGDTLGTVFPIRHPLLQRRDRDFVKLEGGRCTRCTSDEREIADPDLRQRRNAGGAEDKKLPAGKIGWGH